MTNKKFYVVGSFRVQKIGETWVYSSFKLITWWSDSELQKVQNELNLGSPESAPDCAPRFRHPVIHAGQDALCSRHLRHGKDHDSSRASSDHATLAHGERKEVFSNTELESVYDHTAIAWQILHAIRISYPQTATYRTHPESI